MALGRCVPVIVLAVFGLNQTAADISAEAGTIASEGVKGG
jgi:hypothetical protein